jgi:exopolyphosphatase/guanosine-5'-triphosphate,3'-diphosphate pyrophosphatase
VIGTSGTILSLGALAASRESANGSDDVRNLRVSAKAFHKLRKTLVALDLDKRLALPGLDPRRADISVAGSVLFDTILRLLGASEFVLCDLALREGLVLDYVRRNAAHIATVDRYPDVRRRSAIELAERCGQQPAHTARVTKLALAIFDQTAELHGLGAREREWLDHAAVLHDVGMHISHEGHHRHSYYLIKHGDLRGFEPEEIDVLALVARYHRGAPKKSHDEFARMRGPLRRTIRTLSAILSIAEGLDRSHAEVVGSVEVVTSAESVALKVHRSADAELEMWAATRHLAALERALDRKVTLEAVPPHRPATDR